jgi:hypothetical protein
MDERRRPSDRAAAWAWWSASQWRETERPPEPQCGFYRTRVRGQWRAAWIDLQAPTCPETGELIGDEVLTCVVDGEPRNPEEVWLYLRPVTEREFRNLQHAPRVGDLSKEVIL